MQTHYAEEEVLLTKKEPLFKGGLIQTVKRLILGGDGKPAKLEADEKLPQIKTSSLEEVRQKLNIQRYSGKPG